MDIGRSLPGAIRSEQAIDFTAVHRKRDLVNRAGLAKSLGQALDL